MYLNLLIFLSCSCSLYYDPNKNSGAYDRKTNSWNGMIRELQENVTDIAAINMDQTFERALAIDFLTPFNIDR